MKSHARLLLPANLMMAALWSATCAAEAVIMLPPVLAQGATMGAAQPAPRLLPPRSGPADATLRAAVEGFPVLVEAADSEQMLAIVVRADGAIIDARLMPVPDARERARVHSQLYQWLPIADGDGLSQLNFRKGDAIGGSRPLAVDLTILSTRLPADFNPERSTRRATSLMREQRAGLFLPSSSGTINRIVVLLAADGTILKEHVQLFNRADIRPGPRDANHQQSFAETAAAALQISVDEIGVTGAGTSSEGSRSLFVVYAWKRGPGERGPRLYGTPPPPPSVDATAAVTLLTRHLPDAFTSDAARNGTPTLLLSPQGEVVRAGRLPLSNGGLTQAALESSLLGGARIGKVISQSLVNSSGVRRDVLLIWEADGATTQGVRP